MKSPGLCVPLADMDILTTVDRDFMEARAKLIELAAYLDRVDRHGDGMDFRHQALIANLPILTDPGASGHRAMAMLVAFSDPGSEPIAVSPGQAACGAPMPVA